MRYFVGSPLAVRVTLLASLILVPVLSVAQGWFYKRATCKEPSPESVKAWSGCWKLGPAQRLPTEENLFLRMKLTEQEFKLWWGSDEPSRRDEGVFSNPHYCTVSGRYTLAPERDVDFTRRFTMAYEMHDKPIKEWERLVRAREIGRKTEPAEFIQAAKEFVGHGGKYIRTWMIRSDGAAWDSDAEEDMWALPVACEEIERTKAGDKSQPNPR